MLGELPLQGAPYVTIGSELYNPIITLSTLVEFAHPDMMLTLFKGLVACVYCMLTATDSFPRTKAPAWSHRAVPLSFSMPMTYLPAGSELTLKYLLSSPIMPTMSETTQSPWDKLRGATTVKTRFGTTRLGPSLSALVSFPRLMLALFQLVSFPRLVFGIGNASDKSNCVEKK